MSRKGTYWNNAVAERFFLSLKMERIWQCTYANRAETKNDVVDYIAGFYNSTRLHCALSNLPLFVFERNIAAEKSMEVSNFT